MIKVKWDSTYQPAANANGNGNGSTTTNANAATAERPTLTALMDGIVISSTSSTSSNVAGARRPPMPKWDMGTISEDTMPAAFTAASAGWANERFELTESGEVRNRASKARISKQEIRDHGEEVLRGLIDHVHTRMLQELLFLEQAIPPLDSSVRSSSSSICSTNDGFRMMIDTDEPRCIFHTSKNFSVAEKLLVFVCSFRGLSCGIWSRSVLLKDGVQVGSMLPYFQKAIAAGYGILVMNPNMNTQLMVTQDGTVEKMPIRGSSNADEHCDHVWRNYIFPSAAHKVHFIAYGYGGVLVTQLIAKYRYELKSRLGNVAFIESSHKIDPSWNSGFKRFFSQHSISWSRSDFPVNTELSRDATAFAASGGPSGTGTATSSDDAFSATASSPSSRSPKSPSAAQLTGFGCICLSAGPCEGANESPAYTTKAVLDTVFAFLASPTPYEFQRRAARELRLNTLLEEQQARGQTHEEHAGHSGREGQSGRGGHGGHGGHGADNGRPPRDQPARGRKESVYDSVLGGAAGNASHELKPREYDSLTIDDFDLLRVVGRGAFGKVMLVRRKVPQQQKGARLLSPRTMMSMGMTAQQIAGASGGESGKVYAMKVIKKAAVFAKNQVEHTKTERRILQGVDHPFMVKLRYAFQNDAKLYFVMDFYNGGTLHFHLRRAMHFDEVRTRFYAAQLVLAISHLHTYNIVYRDLKPENILLDDQGYIALTDFGLSHDHFDSKDGMQTFCGTPEYIAPELIRRVPYGKAVDYWSLGVLIFEMLAGYTPFYHANRKRNFQNIVKLPLRFPSEFSDDARSLLRGLICRNPAKRLGSGPCGAQEIMDHPFFGSVDWEKLYKRDVHVPFRPVVKSDGEVNNVPEFFKRQEVVDSVVSDAPIGKSHVFQGFSYTDPYNL
ncbi:AGC protein kinase [Phytophthora cinnamomi]|uniref:AGC protein kinase n=1 Tax=Phytophthora cinnamomi TaxID=4785 RepID=UPI00355ACBF8|nr:AGC protein kinase [Phytophthora cinnamomi]